MSWGRWSLIVGAAVALTACGAKTQLEEHPEPGPAPGVPFDAGPGSRMDARVAPPPDGGIRFPDGAMPDAFACPAPCDDGLICNGIDYCEETTNTCEPGLVPSCDDGDECTIDSCDPVANACAHVPMDRDGDGDGISACGGDCDDDDRTVFPGAVERCNLADDDCDGDLDEGVLSECGDCRAGCTIVDMPAEVPWTPGPDNSGGVELAPDGTLRLSETRTEFAFAWIANSTEGTITKLDTRNGAQSATYDSVLTGPGNGARPPNETCRTDSLGGNCPSRTAVDLRGSVYIANRAFFAQGTVTKIAGLEEDCVDRNMNGRIDTSRDTNGDALITGREYLGQRDECILWTVDVGGSSGIPRAIAIAADGSVWVGLHAAQRILQLDASDGRVLRNVSLGTRSFSPYGAAISGDGTLWATEAASGRIISVDTSTGRVGLPRTARSPAGCSGSYGIAVDSRNRVWLAGFQCPVAFRFDPAATSWFTVDLPDSGATRGIAADDRGFVYVAASHTFIRIGVGGFSIGDPITRLTRFRADDGTGVRIWGTTSAPLAGAASTGVGLDHQRRVWLVNQDSGSATRIDTATDAVREFPVGVGPYTYSDFTGFALRTFTAPNGFLRTVVEGCAVGPTEWERVQWNASTPPRTSVSVRVRSAPTRAGLGTAPWIGPFTTTPSDLAMPPGPVPPLRFLEVEVMLVSDDSMRSPQVRSVTVQFNCPV